ncbi:hypothetical protein ES703_10216 [subsurface metagenome]
MSGHQNGNDVSRKRPVRQDAPYIETVEEMDIKSQERIAEKNLELDRDKFEFLKTQAALPAGGYPSLAMEQDKPASLVSMPILLLVGLLFYFVRKKR